MFDIVIPHVRHNAVGASDECSSVKMSRSGIFSKSPDDRSGTSSMLPENNACREASLCEPPPAAGLDIRAAFQKLSVKYAVYANDCNSEVESGDA